MVDIDELRANIQWLHGRRTGVRYRDLRRCLERADCHVVGRSGSHVTWHHASVREHLTLIDAGSGDVLPVYIRKTRQYLQQILAIHDQGA